MPRGLFHLCPAIATLVVVCACTSRDRTGSASSTTTDPSTTATGTDDGSGTRTEGSESTTGPATTGPDLDERLAELLAMQEVPVIPLQAPELPAPELVALGEALFFDPILSGPKDTACASCHHPSFGTSDGLSLALGVGAEGVGPARGEGEHLGFIARHSQSLFNIGHPSFTRMFWDGRVERLADGSLRTPAGTDLPAHVDGPLAAQAMFPVLDRAEMRGEPGGLTVLDEANELAEFADGDFIGIWAAIMARLGELDGYRELFLAAYPTLDFADLDFAHAANAIAAYESQAFSFPDSAWDEYLRGDLEAISDAAKLGAILFYGTAGCARCHSGPLLTDHEFHSTGVPQLGPGKPSSAPLDYGRELVTAERADRFRFRTPSLRNVEISAPYMHSGAHLDLQEVVAHYGNPLLAIEQFDPSGLHPDLVDTVAHDEAHLQELVSTLSEKLELGPHVVGLSNVREFLRTLTDKDVTGLPDARPDAVPSGLDVP